MKKRAEGASPPKAPLNRVSLPETSCLTPVSGAFCRCVKVPLPVKALLKNHRVRRFGSGGRFESVRVYGTSFCFLGLACMSWSGSKR
ncbi:hypothetical protein SUGI_0541400 [Cryptomeria japonica]|nr:hypothetical protein SUGI_0541400 [Cryptomeria japonica]